MIVCRVAHLSVGPPPLTACAMPASEAGTVRTAKTTPRSGAKRKADVDGACGDLLQDIYEESIQEIIALLRKEPSKTLPCLRLVKGDSLLPKAETEGGSGEAPFNSSYKKLYRIPKEDARSILVGAHPSVDDAMWIEIERATDGATRSAFFYIHGISEGTKWPKAALHRSVFRDMFAKVRDMKGDRISGLVTYRGEKNKLMIDWTKFGYYRLLPEDQEQKKQVVHLPSGTKADISEMNIKGKYKIQGNWSETKAEVCYGKLKQRALDFFDDAFIATVDRRSRDLGSLVDIADQIANERLEQEVGEQPATAASFAAGEAPSDEIAAGDGEAAAASPPSQASGSGVAAMAKAEPGPPSQKRRRTVTA